MEVEDSATLQDLLAAVAAGTGLPADGVRLRLGFPPREVPQTDPTASVRALGFTDGDSIRVEEGGPPRAAEAAGAPPAPGLASSSTAPQATDAVAREIARALASATVGYAPPIRRATVRFIRASTFFFCIKDGP